MITIYLIICSFAAGRYWDEDEGWKRNLMSTFCAFTFPLWVVLGTLCFIWKSDHIRMTLILLNIRKVKEKEKMLEAIDYLWILKGSTWRWLASKVKKKLKNERIRQK